MAAQLVVAAGQLAFASVAVGVVYAGVVVFVYSEASAVLVADVVICVAELVVLLFIGCAEMAVMPITESTTTVANKAIVTFFITKPPFTLFWCLCHLGSFF